MKYLIPKGTEIRVNSITSGWEVSTTRKDIVFDTDAPKTQRSPSSMEIITYLDKPVMTSDWGMIDAWSIGEFVLANCEAVRK